MQSAISTHLVQAYKNEEDADVKERMLLVKRVRIDGAVPARVATELGRPRSWAYKWLGRYEAEGMEGLKDGPRSGRPPKVSAPIMARVRKEISESQTGWKVKEVWNYIYERTGVKYHRIYIYNLLHKWGFGRKVPAKRFVNTASRKEKEEFKKRLKPY